MSTSEKQQQQQQQVPQEKCEHGLAYGEDLRQRCEHLQKFFPRSQEATQKFSLLGRSGVKVSKICLGTLNFGQINEEFGSRPGQLDENTAHQILDKYFELGGNCIDTGNFYPWFGTPTEQMSETFVGNWLKNQRRENVFLITKVGLPSGEAIQMNNINSYGFSRMNLYNSVECSLKRLQTDYIDLLQLNVWDPAVNVYDVVRDLDDLIRSGKVRYFGVSSFKGWQLQKILDASRMLDLHRCIAYDGEYNLITRGIENEVAEVCKLEKIGFFAHSPLNHGFLSNKFLQSKEPEQGSRIESASSDNLAAMAEPFEKLKTDPVFHCVLQACERIGKKQGLNVSQVALMWILQKKFVSSAVLSVSSVEELQNAMDTLNKGCLDQEEIEELNTITQTDLQFPNQISLVALDDSKHFEEEFTRPFKNISLLPVLLAEQVFREPHHMLKYEEFKQQYIQQQHREGKHSDDEQQQQQQIRSSSSEQQRTTDQQQPTSQQVEQQKKQPTQPELEKKKVEPLHKLLI